MLINQNRYQTSLFGVQNAIVEHLQHLPLRHLLHCRRLLRSPVEPKSPIFDLLPDPARLLRQTSRGFKNDLDQAVDGLPELLLRHLLQHTHEFGEEGQHALQQDVRFCAGGLDRHLEAPRVFEGARLRPHNVAQLLLGAQLRESWLLDDAAEHSRNRIEAACVHLAEHPVQDRCTVWVGAVRMLHFHADLCARRQLCDELERTIGSRELGSVGEVTVDARVQLAGLLLGGVPVHQPLHNDGFKEPLEVCPRALESDVV
mmetsp:Transcript_18266/g.70585  ORF Transcript_18266/g.70585 Transcript_18266/m.70585 type:complete len:258 (+) Transcript_18266:1306-2079(+)